jgi:ATP-dependent Zn protease
MIRYDQSKADYQQFKPLSDKTIELADRKIKLLVDEAYAKSVKIVKENKKLMELM